VPEYVSDLPILAGMRGAVIGFCGKLPARGDFVAAGLPRRFVEPWHDWMQLMLTASRRMLGEDWLAAWLEAPIWRFALAPGLCGPEAALGLWMPSVDRAGRYFPLTVAAVAATVVSTADLAAWLGMAGGFLGAAQSAGLDALAHDLAPDELAARLAAAAAAAAAAAPGDCGAGPRSCPPGAALWWSEGSSRVPRSMFATSSLPDETEFCGMLDARIVVPPADCGEP